MAKLINMNTDISSTRIVKSVEACDNSILQSTQSWFSGTTKGNSVNHTARIIKHKNNICGRTRGQGGTARITNQNIAIGRAINNSITITSDSPGIGGSIAITSGRSNNKAWAAGNINGESCGTQVTVRILEGVGKNVIYVILAAWGAVIGIVTSSINVQITMATSDR